MTAQRAMGVGALVGLALVCVSCASGPSYQAVCEGKGLKPGTAAFAACVQQQDIDRYGDRRRVLPPEYSAPSSYS